MTRMPTAGIREFRWRRSVVWKFLTLYTAVLIGGIGCFYTMVTTHIGEAISSEWLVFGLLFSVSVVLYGLPRFVGILRNRMCVVVDDLGLVTPLGRRVSAEVISKAAALTNDNNRPYWVRFPSFPISVRIFVSNYQHADDLVRALRGFRD